jgi:hypothetical protein
MRWQRTKNKMVMAMLSIVVVMYISQINVRLHRLMLAKKEGFGNGMM